MDRDSPYGYPSWKTFIYAKDEGGGDTGIEGFAEFVVHVTDINDNAPFLDMPEGLVWNENQEPGTIGELKGDDYDDHNEGNGPPFSYYLGKRV